MPHRTVSKGIIGMMPLILLVRIEELVASNEAFSASKKNEENGIDDYRIKSWVSNAWFKLKRGEFA